MGQLPLCLLGFLDERGSGEIVNGLELEKVVLKLKRVLTPLDEVMVKPVLSMRSGSEDPPSFSISDTLAQVPGPCKPLCSCHLIEPEAVDALGLELVGIISSLELDLDRQVFQPNYPLCLLVLPNERPLRAPEDIEHAILCLLGVIINGRDHPVLEVWPGHPATGPEVVFLKIETDLVEKLWSGGIGFTGARA